MNSSCSTVICLLSVWLSFGASAQTPDAVDSFIRMYESLQNNPTDDGRLALSSQLTESMVSHWNQEPFESKACETLRHSMGAVEVGSGEAHLAVISWNIELTNQSHAYGGVVVFRDRRGNQLVEPLQFKKSNILRPTLDPKSRYTSREWPGAVYYEALIQYQGNKPVYTLLGWDGADNIRTRKIIETLSVSGSKLKFGVPIIVAGLGTTKRYIMEYSDQVSALLQWREDMDMIVMDHLSPPREDLLGQTAYYGPDMSYDGFVWKKNHWEFLEDVDVRDPEVEGPWNNPKRMSKRRRN